MNAEKFAAATITVWKSIIDGPKIGGRFDAVERELAELKAQVPDLKAAPLLKDAGVWRHGSVYGVGDVTTFKGSSWVCTRGHIADGPVADHTYWRLLWKAAR